MSDKVQVTPQAVADAIQELLDVNDDLLATVEYLQYDLDVVSKERDALHLKVRNMEHTWGEAVVAAAKTGDRRPNRPKLTKTEVENIRSLRRSGYSQAEIADIYDVNPATVSRIVRGQYYRTAV